jgi:hypothetical protein
MGECACEPGKVAGRCLPPAIGVGVAAIQVDEEATEGANVLVVVTDHVDERARLAPAQVVEVAARNLPAGDVRVAPQPQQLRLDRRQTGIGHPMPEEPADDRQQVEVPGMQRRIRTRHAVARDEQRPVEAATVVRDEPAARRNPRGELGEECGLIGMIWEQELHLAEPAAFPPAQPDEEREGARRRRQARGLRVEAEQGSVGRRLAG